MCYMTGFIMIFCRGLFTDNTINIQTIGNRLYHQMFHLDSWVVVSLFSLIQIN